VKREAQLKALLVAKVKELLPPFVVIAHTETFRAGVPDLSITGGGRTTWWECKHGTPGFASTGIQELTCLRLAIAGYCRYIIWSEAYDGTDKQTLIVHPRKLKDVEPELSFSSYNMTKLVDLIAKIHQ